MIIDKWKPTDNTADAMRQSARDLINRQREIMLDSDVAASGFPYQGITVSGGNACGNWIGKLKSNKCDKDGTHITYAGSFYRESNFFKIFRWQVLESYSQGQPPAAEDGLGSLDRIRMEFRTEKEGEQTCIRRILGLQAKITCFITSVDLWQNTDEEKNRLGLSRNRRLKEFSSPEEEDWQRYKDRERIYWNLSDALGILGLIQSQPHQTRRSDSTPSDFFKFS